MQINSKCFIGPVVIKSSMIGCFIMTCAFFFLFPFALCLQVKSALNGVSQLCRQGSVYDSPALFWGMWKV